MRIVRSLKAALAAGVLAVGAVAATPAWADRGFERHHGFERHRGWGHERHHYGAWGLGVGLLAGTAIAMAIAEPRPVVVPTVHMPPRVVVAAPAPVLVEQSWWYYCASPAGYYPYVAACPTGWTRVAPTPIQ